ncbi:hypothetical protein [Paraburkholderia strydomiana]|uniref:hypothetical protein n=1 Tax=Paraburkholderia strydomiana TaxID=1245417 RepID=UPI001BE5894B|nr:hypothetical protein [Paraburkholderia strydomiana]MBT2791050.1 hypothetical protein [Paraburkholderia strydomiana]
MKADIVLSVVLYSYLDRPIFDVMLNGSGIGGANSYGTNGMITGIRVPFGKQGLTWRLDGPPGMARNGETVAMKNSINLVAEQIPADAHYLAVNIYPDDTAEFVFDESIPDTTPRGKIIDERRQHGK